MTLMFFFVWTSNDFHAFAEFFFRQNCQLLLYIVPSAPNVLRTSRQTCNGNARQQFSEFLFTCFKPDRKICPTLLQCKQYFSEMGFLKICLLILGNLKMNADGIHYIPHSYYCQKF